MLCNLNQTASTLDTMTGLNPIKDPLMAAFPDAPQSAQGIRRIGVDPVGKLLGVPLASSPTRRRRPAL